MPTRNVYVHYKIPPVPGSDDILNHNQDNWVRDHSQVTDLSDPSKKLLSEELQSHIKALGVFAAGVTSW